MTRLLLAGGGHVQLAVLRSLIRRPLPDATITLVSEADSLFYSGMLPGWMAGAYRLDQLAVPLAPLADRAGARFLEARVTAIDAEAQVLHAGDHRLAWDRLVLATGAMIATAPFEALGHRLLPLRPIPRFVARWTALMAALPSGRPFRLDIAGGGAGGVELALAASLALRRTGCRPELRLFAGDRGLLPGHPVGTRRRVRRHLAEAGIHLIEERATGEQERDLMIAATGAAPPGFLPASGIALSDRGFVATGATLQSLSHPHVLAAGDVAVRLDHPVDHSGLQAVRAGPVVAANLRALATGGRAARHRLWKPDLYLLATRPGHAIASGDGWSAEGNWLWQLKDWIDRRYVDRHRVTSHDDGTNRPGKGPFPK